MIEACCSVLLSAGWFGRVLGAALFWAVPLLAVFLVIQLGCFFSFAIIVFLGRLICFPVHP